MPSRTISNRISCVKGTSKTWRVGCTRVNTWIWFSRVLQTLWGYGPDPLNNHLLLLSYQHLPDISDPAPSNFAPKQNQIAWESYCGSTEANPCPPHQSSSTNTAMAAVYSAAPLHTWQPVADMQTCWVNCGHTDDYMLIPSRCLNAAFVEEVAYKWIFFFCCC